MTQRYDRKRKAWVPKKSRANEARARETQRLAEKIVPLESRLTLLEGSFERTMRSVREIYESVDAEIKQIRRDANKSAGATVFGADFIDKAKHHFFDHDDLDQIMAAGMIPPGRTIVPPDVINRLVEMARTHIRVQELVATGKGDK